MQRRRGTIHSARATKRGKELGPSFVDLPFSITTDILLRLPVKVILICKLVCRTWNTLISDPHFAKLQFDRTRFGFMIRVWDEKLVSRNLYLLEDEPSKLKRNRNNILKLEPTFKLPLRDAKLVLDKQDGTDGLLVCKTEDHRFDVMNSCNGLLCLSDPFNSHPLVVCNPVTGEFIRLPKVVKGSKGTLCSGIGFQTKTNEYKVLRIVCDILKFEINVVGTPTWRNVRLDGNFSSLLWQKSPTFVNEALHWICISKKYLILRFHFETEKVELIDLPSTLEHEYFSVGALRDSFYVCSSPFLSLVDVWIMKNDDTGVLWTKTITLTSELHRDIRSYWPSTNSDNENCILGYCSKNGFIYNDTKNRPKKFLVFGIQEKLLDVIPHIPSLISLKYVVKGDDVEVLNVHSRCAKFKLLEE